MKNNKGVLIFIEQRDQIIQNVAIELLGEGKKLAQKLTVPLMACVLGKKINPLIEEVNQYGPDEIYFVDDPILESYVNEPYTKALTRVIQEVKPEIVLIGATSLGRDLAPRVSSRLHTGLTADCTSLDIDDKGQLLMTRPAFGGNLMATIVCADHRPQMSTVRPGVMVKAQVSDNHRAIVNCVDVQFNSSDMNVDIIEEIRQSKNKINIEDAHVLISAGRGVGSKKNMKHIETLANHLTGQVSGTRAVVENGWLDKERQVGQTGKTVRPDLYVACGISGAIQHVSGMEDSGLIIAINKNPSAAIFDVADIGIVGDGSKVIPALNKQLGKK
ncbi:MAG TPA: electron transfer flavoprotein subunit alpha/FixB family protein [Candidatus Izemoplasmatales bacterium]|nr:electron transfer flavoprotein subunit alpha/FixB family protein [Candidatus Izemoplasmatales bacterium]